MEGEGGGGGEGEGGRGNKVPVLISIIENFLDIHGIATRSRNVSPNFFENMIFWKICVKGITCITNAMFGNFQIISNS